jgi:iron-sulfur cluster repair protein YtfE (RIC family)
MWNSIRAWFVLDHARLQRLFERFTELRALEPPAAGAALGEFVHGLETHMDLEERLLFPLFERCTGLEWGPTQTLRADHAQLRERLAEVTAAVCDDAAHALNLKTLRSLLAAHDVREENLLYPVLDQMLDPIDRAAVLEALAEIESGTPSVA